MVGSGSPDKAPIWRSIKRRRLWGASIVGAVLGVASVVSIALASGVSAGDKAATDGYLNAGYAYAQATLATVRQSQTAVEGLAGKLGSECPGILKGAPPEPSSSTPFARQVGESKREDEQLGELEYELSRALNLTLEQPNDQALRAFAGATRSLHWSNPTLTRLVSTQATELERQVAGSIPDVCDDMKAWVASGYKTLAATTKELQAQQEEASRNAIARRAPTPSISTLLVTYEKPAEKALIAKTKTLEKERVKALVSIKGVYERLNDVLGIATPGKEPTVSHPPPGAVVIGKGKTAAGGEYEVLLETKEESSSGWRHGPCSPQNPLNIRILTTAGGAVSGCYPRTAGALPPMVNCREGLLTIETQTPPGVQSVRLRMSNGRQITSPVATVPAQLGGPTGFYYQVVRGPTPIPVSLAELDMNGRVLRMVKLHRFAGCTKHLLKFLHHGIRILVHSRVPRGPAFSIKGEAYRFLGHIHFALAVEVTNGAGGGESPSGRKPSLFSWAVWRACKPHPYAILYGLLKNPSDTVLARTAGTLRRLRRAPIPAYLHAGGVLVYTASTTVPSELIVRTPSGRTVLTEKLGRLGAEATETCQGEAER